MLVFLHESNTGATYNGIIRFQNDLIVLIRNFIQEIKIKYRICENDMNISVT